MQIEKHCHLCAKALTEKERICTHCGAQQAHSFAFGFFACLAIIFLFIGTLIVTITQDKISDMQREHSISIDRHVTFEK